MTAHLTEEEQLETLKRWWADNGKSTLVGIVLAVAAYLGWGAWQDNRILQAEKASEQYQLLLEATRTMPGQAMSDDNLATANHLIGDLKSHHEGSLYASLAVMFSAKLAIDGDNFTDAEKELQWVIQQNTDEALTLLAKLRLSRVQLAEKNYDAALQTVAGTENAAFKGAFAETRGDILLAKGDKAGARAAYEMAKDTLLTDLEPRKALLEMKLQDLEDGSSDTSSSAAEGVTP